MTKPIAFCLALILLLAGGVLHGLYAERWIESEALRLAVERLDTVPLVVGGWTGKDEATDPLEFEQAGARGHWMRTYTHTQSGAQVLVILMAGRAGKMSVHTPEVCYRGAGFDLRGAPIAYAVRSDLGDPLGTFWSARFGKQTAAAADLHLFWAWASTAPWSAAESPRWQYRGEPFLYKLYVSHLNGGPRVQPAENNVGADFLRQFLPELNFRLFSIQDTNIP